MPYKDYPLCEYAFYEEQPNKMVMLKCNKTNGLCAYSRYCSLQLKVVHTSSYVKCALKNKFNED